jgi:hypothetical protein
MDFSDSTASSFFLRKDDIESRQYYFSLIVLLWSCGYDTLLLCGYEDLL